MKEVKKSLYLLQLEEYQTERYLSWLKKHPIKKLEERKKALEEKKKKIAEEKEAAKKAKEPKTETENKN